MSKSLTGAVTAATGEPPCGAFGAMEIFIGIGGAVAHALLTSSVVGASALAAYLQNQRA